MARSLVLALALVGCADAVELDAGPCGNEPTIPVYSVEHDHSTDTICMRRIDYLKLRDYVVWARCMSLSTWRE